MRTRRIRPLLAAAVATGALLAVGAAPAMGAVTWTSTGTITLTGSLTVKENGANPKTCTVNASGPASNGLGIAAATIRQASDYYINLPCTGGTTLQMEAAPGWAYGSPGNYLFLFSSAGTLLSPYGGTYANHYAEPSFVNGAGATKSTLVFNNTYIGVDNGPITATGTITVGNGSTGTRTLTGSD